MSPYSEVTVGWEEIGVFEKCVNELHVLRLICTIKYFLAH